MKNASKYEIISSQGEGGQLEKDHDIVLNDARLTGLFLNKFKGDETVE